MQIAWQVNCREVLTVGLTRTAGAGYLYGCTGFSGICGKDSEKLVGVWSIYDYSGERLFAPKAGLLG